MPGRVLLSQGDRRYDCDGPDLLRRLRNIIQDAEELDMKLWDAIAAAAGPTNLGDA